jgi:hypothetical protein
LGTKIQIIFHITKRFVTKRFETARFRFPSASARNEKSFLQRKILTQSTFSFYFQGFKASRPQDLKVSSLQGFKASRLPSQYF